MLNIILEQGYGLTTMAAVAVVAVVLAAVFYRRAFGSLQTWQWLSLLTLRVAAIVLVVLLLFRPVLTYYKELKEQPALIFVLDTSSSMSIADDATGVTRFDQARSRIESWWEPLDRDFDLHLIEFSEQASPLEEVASLAGITPEGKATSLSRGLLAAAEELLPEKIEAVVLLSDGVDNSSGDPVETARTLGAVVHTIGVGASLRNNAAYRDVQITGIDCPATMLVNNLAKITASVEGIGLPGRVVTVVLEDAILGDAAEAIDERELTLDETDGSQDVAFEFRPTKKGRHTFTVRIPPVGEEKIEENNHRSAVAQVVEPGIRVLYLEGTLRAEYGALVDRFLAKDPDLEFCALVQTRPNKFLRRSNIEGLVLDAIPSDAESIDTFNVFIIGDLDVTYLRPAVQELIVRRIREGAGLVMLGGYHSLGPGGYDGTPLGDVLPVFLGSREIGQITDPFLPRLTPDGAHHPIFANIADFFPSEQGPARIEGLPTLDGCTRVEGRRPAATVLARVMDPTAAMPVLAVQPVDRGRTAVFCGDTTRQWQQGPQALDQESPFLRFWGQMVRWLAGRDVAVDVEAGIVAATDRTYYAPGESIRISAVVRDARGTGASDAAVVANIRDPAGLLIPVLLDPMPGPDGNYAADFEPATPGQFEITPSARAGTTELVGETILVEVGRPAMEFEELDLDDGLLARIAADTGGRYHHIATADRLIEQFDRTQRERREYLEVRLYHPPVFWLLFVVLLTTEWVLRRRFQLR
ncbi:MAG: glutamine amidotransferase [Thermoguttaceae bacterium]